MRHLLLTLVVCTVWQGAAGFSRGAPACVKQPGHKTEPQTSALPYQISLRKYVSQGKFSGKWLLVVGSEADDAPDYKGILIKASQSGTMTSLDNNKMFKPIERGCNDLPSWTHSNNWSREENTEKRKSEWEFQQVDGSSQEPTFSIHIVQSFTMFWVDIEVTPSKADPIEDTPEPEQAATSTAPAAAVASEQADTKAAPAQVDETSTDFAAEAAAAEAADAAVEEAAAAEEVPTADEAVEGSADTAEGSGTA